MANQRLTHLALLSILAAVLTLGLKAAGWACTGSVSLLSDAAESLVNLTELSPAGLDEMSNAVLDLEDHARETNPDLFAGTSDVLDASAAGGTCALLCEDEAFLEALISRAFAHPDSPSCAYLPLAAARLASTNPRRFREVVGNALDNSHEQLAYAGARALSMVRLSSPTPADLALLLRGADSVPGMRRWILPDIGRIAAAHSSLLAQAVEALRNIACDDEDAADDLCVLLDHNQPAILDRVPEGRPSTHPHALATGGGDLVPDAFASNFALELGERQQHV